MYLQGQPVSFVEIGEHIHFTTQTCSLGFPTQDLDVAAKQGATGQTYSSIPSFQGKNIITFCFGNGVHSTLHVYSTVSMANRKNLKGPCLTALFIDTYCMFINI